MDDFDTLSGIWHDLKQQGRRFDYLPEEQTAILLAKELFVFILIFECVAELKALSHNGLLHHLASIICGEKTQTSIDEEAKNDSIAVQLCGCGLLFPMGDVIEGVYKRCRQLAVIDNLSLMKINVTAEISTPQPSAVDLRKIRNESVYSPKVTQFYPLNLLDLILVQTGFYSEGACPTGFFKPAQGDEKCLQCPINSRTTNDGATNCVCRNGYYRTDSDPLEMPCTTVSSAPQNVISSVNETSLMLEWNSPRESGGRDDVVYNIICKSCGGGRGGCTRCGDNVQFNPRQLGLTETRVFISDLLAHTQYTFEIQAVNGVSDQSPYSPQYTSVNITTNQAEQETTDRIKTDS
ncbi:Ephrin type-B receptor 2 [Triplophysa tibetana]|uniref:Ephrin type-B receptor 2 n=1 Tax=Triplophysa tibetana TaxID=1572043 RepID=A0A5A9NFJ3_9TELE|nr:Ephrin type-B receptor 2 [Triplophysa tibetana]